MSKIDVIVDLSGNGLSQFPAHALEMDHLKMLYLEGNKIQKLPEGLFQCLPKLTWLDLRNNLLVTIPVGIKGHIYLESLLLQNNKIEELPTELGFVPNLKVLQLSGNPLIYPLPEIVSSGIERIVRFLREEHEIKNKEYELQSKASDSSNKTEYTSCIGSMTDLRRANKLPRHRVSLRKLHLAKKTKSIQSCKKASNSHLNSNKYFKMKEVKRNDEKLEEMQLRELWLEKLKSMIEAQESFLQQKKNVEALKKWRKEVRRNYSVVWQREAPFDTDPEYDRMPSRHELLLPERQPERHHTPKKVDIQQLIDEMVESLKLAEREHDVETDLTPRAQMSSAASEIKRITDLQKRLSAVRMVNKKYL